MNKLSLKNIFFTILFLTLSTIIIGTLIFLFCELFYKFGNIAKKTITNYPKISLFIMPILLWFSAYICKKYASNASGSNLDHITEAINRLKSKPNNYQLIKDLLSLRIIAIAIISSLIATLAGGSLGREGISIYIGTTLFVVFANFAQKFLPLIALECWIYLGYALGFSVAFNAPFAGLIYVIEKLIKNRSINFKIISILTVFVITLSIIPLAKMPEVYQAPKVDFKFSSTAITIYFFIAILCGLMVYVFRNFLNFGYKKISNLQGFSWHFTVIILGFFIILIADFFGIYVIGGGIKTVNDAFNFQGILIDHNDFFARFITTILTFIIGCSGGTVAPSITLGAGLSSSISQIANLDLLSMMLVGMSCFLSPLLATPITSALVIVESTRQNFYLFFLIVPFSLIAFFVYFYLNKFIATLKIKFVQAKL